MYGARFLSISSEWGGAMLTFRGVNIPGKDWILDKRLLSGDKKVTCNPRPYKFHNCFNTILIEFQVPLNAQTWKDVGHRHSVNSGFVFSQCKILFGRKKTSNDCKVETQPNFVIFDQKFNQQLKVSKWIRRVIAQGVRQADQGSYECQVIKDNNHFCFTIFLFFDNDNNDENDNNPNNNARFPRSKRLPRKWSWSSSSLRF